jgi:hypothetical protein
MSLSEVLTNTIAVCAAGGYKKADFRTPLEQQSHGGVDRRFQVFVDTASQTLARHAQPNAFGDIRTARVTVRVAYVRLGGDKGGALHGGDTFNVNVRAFDDMLALGPRLESPDLYDAQNTGIRRRSLDSAAGFRQTYSDDRMEIWDAVFSCEFEEPQDRRAVA